MRLKNALRRFAPALAAVVIGISSDGVEVFDNGVDALGRNVTRDALSTRPGEVTGVDAFGQLSAIDWFLTESAAATPPNFFRRRLGT